jgi:hypothetical protein
MHVGQAYDKVFGQWHLPKERPSQGLSNNPTSTELAGRSGRWYHQTRRDYQELYAIEGADRFAPKKKPRRRTAPQGSIG